jgi:hypothetical protein
MTNNTLRQTQVRLPLVFDEQRRQNFIQMKGQDWVEENVEEVRDTIKATINVNDDEWHTA